MDTENELTRFKGILFAVLAFLVSAYFSYGELKFAGWGKTAEAKVTRTHQTRNFSKRLLLRVEYQFTEADGTGRSERDDVAIDWPAPGTGNVTVQYLPGVAGSSRLLGNSNMMAVYIVLGCLAWLSFSGYKLWREANEALHGSGRRRRK